MYTAMEDHPGDPIRVKKVEPAAAAAAPAAAPVVASNGDAYCLLFSGVFAFVFCIFMLQITLNPLVTELRIHNELLNMSLYQTAELVTILEKVNHFYI